MAENEKDQLPANETPEFNQEEFNQTMRELGQCAGEVLGALQSGLTALFEEMTQALDKELSTDADNIVVTSDTFGVQHGAKLLGAWECPELQQTIIVALLNISIRRGGVELWNGAWTETKDENCTVLANESGSMGYYTRLEYYPEEEMLAAVLPDAGIGKQYIRFVRKKN